MATFILKHQMLTEEQIAKVTAQSGETFSVRATVGDAKGDFRLSNWKDRRIYINSADSRQAGYIDLMDGEVVATDRFQPFVDAVIDHCLAL